MNTGKELNYRLYVQKRNGFTRSSFNWEMSRYMSIQQGYKAQKKKEQGSDGPDVL